MFAGRGPGILWSNQLALALSISANEGDDIASFSAAGFRENFHKVLLTVLSAGSGAGLLAIAGLDGPGSWPPLPYVPACPKRVGRSTRLVLAYGWLLYRNVKRSTRERQGERRRRRPLGMSTEQTDKQEGTPDVRSTALENSLLIRDLGRGPWTYSQPRPEEEAIFCLCSQAHD